jgi:hypothetical protein
MEGCKIIFENLLTFPHKYGSAVFPWWHNELRMIVTEKDDVL